MAGPTSTCASARKAGRFTNGYGRHSLPPNLVSEVSRLGRSVGESVTRIETVVTWQRRAFAREAGLRLTGTRGPTGLGRPCSARQPSLPRGQGSLRGRFVGEEKPCTGLYLLVHGHVQGMDRFRPSADVLIARFVVVEIGEFY